MRSRYLVNTLVILGAAVLMSSSAWAQTSEILERAADAVGRSGISRDAGRRTTCRARRTRGRSHSGRRATLNDKEFAERAGGSGAAGSSRR